MKIKKDIDYSIDSIKLNKNTITLYGWAASEDPDNKVFFDVKIFMFISKKFS